MDISAYNFRKTVDEINKGSEMALNHAHSILKYFNALSPHGQEIMIETLKEHIPDSLIKIKRNKKQ